MKCTPEKNDPFSFEGPEIYKCKVNIFNLNLYLRFHMKKNLLNVQHIHSNDLYRVV